MRLNVLVNLGGMAMPGTFVPHHINAEFCDFEGNMGRGRYVILPGSDGRAEKIASLWNNVKVKKHDRNHNLYLGTMRTESGEIDMAVVSTGMGAASADIIINELINLGARNLIRVGTAGSLQPDYVRAGSIVVPTGSVKDESTSGRYLPVEVPAVPSFDFLVAARAAAIRVDYPVYFGVVHSKDSFFAREMKAGPKRRENEEYMELLKAGGVLATEMETSILFTLGQVYGRQFSMAGSLSRVNKLTNGSNYGNNGNNHAINNDNCDGNKKDGNPSIMTGAVLAVIGDLSPFGGKDVEEAAVDAAISFCMKTVEILHFKHEMLRFSR